MAIGRGSGREERLEPRFDAGADPRDLRLTQADRPTGPADPSERDARPEPRLDAHPDGRREPDMSPSFSASRDETGERREPNFGRPANAAPGSRA